MHRRDAAQFRIDFRNKRAELQLFCELARVEVAYCARLDFSRVDLRAVDRFFSSLSDDVPDRFALLFQVALKIRAPAAENVDFVHGNYEFIRSSNPVIPSEARDLTHLMWTIVRSFAVFAAQGTLLFTRQRPRSR